MYKKSALLFYIDKKEPVICDSNNATCSYKLGGKASM